jgi:hypothetical protein
MYKFGLACLLLSGCAMDKLDLYENAQACEKLKLPAEAYPAAADYIIPAIKPEYKKTIKEPLPPDLSK